MYTVKMYDMKEHEKHKSSDLFTAILPPEAARPAHWYMTSKFCRFIAFLSNMASDRTTDDAPALKYSPTESVYKTRYHLV